MDDQVQVHTNNIPRDLIYFFQFTPEEQEKLLDEYNHLEVYSEEERDTLEFFRYKGEIYSLDEFMSVHNKTYNPNPPNWMKQWDGFFSQGFIGGLVVRFCEEYDNEKIVVGYY